MKGDFNGFQKTKRLLRISFSYKGMAEDCQGGIVVLLVAGSSLLVARCPVLAGKVEGVDSGWDL